MTVYDFVASSFWLQIRMLKRQAMEAVEDMEEMRRTHKDNANVSMQLLKKVTSSCRVASTETTLPLSRRCPTPLDSSRISP